MGDILKVCWVASGGCGCRTFVEGVLLDSPDLERIFRFYSARFQIEFAFRDAKQYLNLNDGPVHSQAILHFHFNIVFAARF